MSKDPKKTITEQLKNDNVRYLMVDFPDIHGFSKGRVIPISRLPFAIESGPSFTGGSVPGAGQGPEHPEMVARADFATYTPMPWLPVPGVAHLMSSLEVQGKPHPYCPRGNLQRVLERAKGLGYQLKLGVELEHYVVKRDYAGRRTPWNPQGFDGANMPGYNLNALIPMLPYLTTMMDHFNSLGWEVYQVDHEDGPGQCEINFQYQDALITCDRAMYFRLASRHIAKQTLGNNVHVTFQAKPFPDFCGSGLHFHFHLADAKTGENLFLSSEDPRKLGLSPLAYKFMGGIFAHAPALCAITNPTPNCYTRLHPPKTPDSGNHWIPASILYSGDNRTVMIRVPEAGHCEDRSPSGACNLYLAVAAYVAAGIEGITKDLNPGEPWYGSALTAAEKSTRQLPDSLREALDALEKDEVVQEALGPIAEVFIRMKREEAKQEEPPIGSYFHYL